MPARPRRAASISVRVGPVVSVAISRLRLAGARLKSGIGRDVENLLHDLSNRGQRVELSALNLVEQPTQLGVPGDRLLEMHLGACGRDRKHLACEILSPPLL